MVHSTIIQKYTRISRAAVFKCSSDKLLLPSRNLFVQSQQWKHQSNMRNLFKVDNEDSGVVLMSLLLILNKFQTLLALVFQQLKFKQMLVRKLCWKLPGKYQRWNLKANDNTLASLILGKRASWIQCDP